MAVFVFLRREKETPPKNDVLGGEETGARSFSSLNRARAFLDARTTSSPSKNARPFKTTHHHHQKSSLPKPPRHSTREQAWRPALPFFSASARWSFAPFSSARRTLVRCACVFRQEIGGTDACWPAAWRPHRTSLSRARHKQKTRARRRRCAPPPARPRACADDRRLSGGRRAGKG